MLNGLSPFLQEGGVCPSAAELGWGNMDDDRTLYIGTRETWGGQAPFGLQQHDRRQHVYIIGKSGTGKTTLLRNMLVQDILTDQGVGVLDPHGDLATELLDCIPPSRIDDTVYCNPADHDHPVAFNLLRADHATSSHLVSSGIVGAFKGLWGDSWGPRMEYILYACVAALAECDNVSLLGVQRMLIDDRYRRWVLRQVRDPMVRLFWEREFGSYERRYLQEAIAPIQNKIGQLLMATPLRNILGQVGNKVDAADIMNNRRIFIANLSKGLIGEDKANLLGAMLVTSFQLAAIGRAAVPHEKRSPFYLYVDEFHNFTSDSFASILAEARKYGLYLTLSHQYIGQMRDMNRDAVFGNVGSMVAFRVGEADAAVLAREYGDDQAMPLFTELSNHGVYAKLLDRGEPHSPFRGRTLPPLPIGYGRGETVIERSRQRYTTDRKTVEDRIQRWMR